VANVAAFIRKPRFKRGTLPPSVASIKSSSQTLIANIIGASLLSLPFTIKRAGLIPGIIAMLVMCFVNASTALILAKCCEITGNFTYKGIAEAALGKRAGVVIACCLVVYVLGSGVSFAVILQDYLPSLMTLAFTPQCGLNGAQCEGTGTWDARKVLTNPALMVMLPGFLLLTPLSLNRNLDSLRFTSTMSLCCIAYCFFMLMILCGQARADGSAPTGDQLNIQGQPAGLAIALPILLASFTCHFSIPRLYGELQQRSIARFRTVLMISFGFVLTVYMGAAVSGYLLLGPKVIGNVLKSFPISEPPIVVGRLAFSLIVIGGFPLAFLSLRTNVVSLLPTWMANRIKKPKYPTDEELGFRPKQQRAGSVAAVAVSLSNKSLLPSSPSSLSLAGPPGSTATTAIVTKLRLCPLSRHPQVSTRRC
jgi:amino acid permease